MHITLGNVTFSAFEVPPSIQFGGAQRLVVQTLPGGGRVIDAMGQDDADISWSGILTGPDAASRARLLDSLRIAGDALPLVWDSFAYNVIIADLALQFRNPWWIPYRLRCVVATSAQPTAPATTELTAQAVLTDLASAGADLDISGITPAFVAAQLQSSPAANIALMTQGAAFITDVGNTIQQAGMVLDDSASTLSAVLAAANTQAQQQTGLGYITRAIKNQIGAD